MTLKNEGLGEMKAKQNSSESQFDTFFSLSTVEQCGIKNSRYDDEDDYVDARRNDVERTMYEIIQIFFYLFFLSRRSVSEDVKVENSYDKQSLHRRYMFRAVKAASCERLLMDNELTSHSNSMNIMLSRVIYMSNDNDVLNYVKMQRNLWRKFKIQENSLNLILYVMSHIVSYLYDANFLIKFTYII